MLSLFLQKNLGELCRSKYGQRIILQLLHPDQQKYVPLHLQQMMHPPSKPASGFEASREQEPEQVRLPLSICLLRLSSLSLKKLMAMSACGVKVMAVKHRIYSKLWQAFASWI